METERGSRPSRREQQTRRDGLRTRPVRRAANLDDPEVADLFAFLLETNEARQSIARGDDLRESIMRPVDIDDIKNRIRELEGQEDKTSDELATIEDGKSDTRKFEQR
ncbi:hypothetical protein [Haloarcula sp. JP-L23]|uniref:hypothetical protein n=1 Tax=Haloarcula sp. JP-L23 TaxID=2716717 RepID=UPI00140F0C29|nr:hypothetical protein G9465_21015 [Haloarcula sp. JP-L23]